MSDQINNLYDFASLLDEPLMKTDAAVLITLTRVEGSIQPAVGIFAYNMGEADHREACNEYWRATNPHVIEMLDQVAAEVKAEAALATAKAQLQTEEGAKRFVDWVMTYDPDLND